MCMAHDNFINRDLNISLNISLHYTENVRLSATLIIRPSSFLFLYCHVGGWE